MKFNLSYSNPIEMLQICTNLRLDAIYGSHGPPTQKIRPLIAEKGITAAATSTNWQKFCKEVYFLDSKREFLWSYAQYLYQFANCSHGP